ncbi:unnamed protein product [Oppiella nova]|uniref:Uncharacterized protein n=1 Tax=Oppiella nova TaxID=334625 RepID=A0A7R9M4N5_9ACAR|nr:unnamed protein product [Oppiella nova]CAG2170601.1 unnamed protein product [Oppiella nova]
MVQNVDNLCDSLKLKSSSKQIMQNANGDNSESDAKNSVKNSSKIIGDTIDTKTANNSLNRRRNTIQYTSGPAIGAVNGVKNNSNNNNANNHHLNGDQLYALQEMCQQFKRIINQLEDKIIGLEKVNKTLEIDNETLAYKLSESQSQSDHLENQLLKLSDKKRQSQDLKEVEEYLEHVWKLSNDRLRQLETENKTLKKQIIINTHNNANSSNELNGKPINSNHNNGSNHTLSNGCSPALVFKQNVDNLCDSLKLKSSSKQIMQNANGDNSESDAKNSVKNNSKIIGDTIDTKAANNSLNRRRNTIQYTSGLAIGAVNGVKNNSNNNNNNNANNHHLNGDQLYALQEMCQQFKRIINQLEDKIIGLEKVNKTLEIDNETLAYKG